MNHAPATSPASFVAPVAMTVAEFLDWARIGRTTAYREAKSGRLKLHKIGRKTIVTRESALAWLSNLPEAEPTKNVA